MRLQNARGDHRLRADAEDSDAVERLDQVVLVEGTRMPFDVEADGVEERIRLRVRVFEEKGL